MPAPFTPASFWLPSWPSPRRRRAPDRGPSPPRGPRLERSPPSPRGGLQENVSASIASIRHESSAPRSRLSFNSKPRPVTSRQIASPATRKTGRRPSSAAAASNGIGTRSCRGPSSTRICRPASLSSARTTCDTKATSSVFMGAVSVALMRTSGASRPGPQAGRGRRRRGGSFSRSREP